MSEDLIRRDDAIKTVAEVLSLNRFASFKNVKDFGRFAERMLRNVPSAEAKEYINSAPSIDIVRCKECKHKPICSHSVQHTTHEPTSVTIGYKSVDFCSYGERDKDTKSRKDQTMSRWIDADALITELEKDESQFDKEAEDARNNPSAYTDGYADAMWSRANGIRDAMIEIYDAPSIDIVRCSECKHCVPYSTCNGDYQMCMRWEDYSCDVNLNDFCSYGERSSE